MTLSIITKVDTTEVAQLFNAQDMLLGSDDGGSPLTLPETPAFSGSPSVQPETLDDVFGEVPPAVTPAAKAKRASVTTPLKKGGALQRQVNKYVCNIKSILVQMSSMKYQADLRTRLNTISDDAESIYNDIGSLLKAGANDDASYEKSLRSFLELRNANNDDITEAQGVMSAAFRPAKTAVAKKRQER